MDPVNVRAVVTAAREVTHATSHLASIAGDVARREAADEECRQAAMLASSEAAKLALALDDVYRTYDGGPHSLDAAERALAAAEAAVRAARETIAKCRGGVTPA